MVGHAHSHSHSHSHGLGHGHSTGNFGRAFAIGILLNLSFVVAEVVFGFLANSMSLLADAGHNLSDVLGLVLGWAAAMMARRGASPRFTYGFKKAPILAALANSLLLLLAVGAIASEAVRRLFHPAVTEGGTVIIVAAAGILINGLTALLFAGGRHEDLNIRGAYVHMAADAFVSIAVVIAGLAIMWTGREWIDPAMSLAVAILILWGSIGLLKESVWMSLAGVPRGIDVEEVELALAKLEGVGGVHDLHIWPLSTTETALTAHLVTAQADYPDALLENARKLLHDRFHIEHCTIQVERDHPAHHKNC
ncbi:MAG TPA: cation diffusion facilitator family transporter [Sphingomicrobium sp.]|nr:cation diffusion facilitator family transporter [Sphingomicrobium sp.]